MTDPLRQFFPNLPVANPPQMQPQPPFMPSPPPGGIPYHFAAQMAGHMSPMRMASPPPHLMQQPQPPTGQDARSLENLLKQQLGVDAQPTNSVENHHRQPTPPPHSSPSPPVHHPQQIPSSPLQSQPPQPQSNTSPAPALTRADSLKRRKRTTPEIGIQLSGRETVYAPGQAHSSTQLEASPITILATPLIYQLGNMIAVNKNYICYAVKGNMIRVINIYTAQRSLLKGHTDQIMDMKFFSNEVDLLASVGKDGNIFVWKIFEVEADASLSQNLVLHVKPQGKPVPQTRVLWHPRAQVMATLGGNDTAYIWDVEQLGIHNKEAGPVLFDPEATVLGIRKIPRGSKLNDLAFSPDGKQLALAEEAGAVSLWDISDPTGEPQHIHTWEPHERNPATAVLYCPTKVQTTDEEKVVGHILLTGGSNNSQLRLWDPKSWACLQTLDFQPSAETKEFYNHLIFEPPFVLVANSKSTSIYVLHIDLSLLPTDGAEATLDTREASLDVESCSFDYVTEFAMAQPVLSFNTLKRILDTNPTQVQIGLYCVQTKAIQMYHLKPELCYPASLQKKKKELRRSLGAQPTIKHAASSPAPSSEHVSTITDHPPSPPTTEEPTQSKHEGEREEERRGAEEDLDTKVSQEQDEAKEKETEIVPPSEQEVKKEEPEGLEQQPIGEEADTQNKEPEGEITAQRPEAAQQPDTAEGKPEEREVAEPVVQPPTTEEQPVEEAKPPDVNVPSPVGAEGEEEADRKPDMGEPANKEEPPPTQREGAEPVATPVLQDTSAVPPAEGGVTDAIGLPNKEADVGDVKEPAQPTTPSKMGKSPSKNVNLNAKKKKVKKINSLKVGKEADSTSAVPPSVQAEEPKASVNGGKNPREHGNKDLKKELKALENSINARMERTLQQHVDRQFARLERERQEKEKADREQQQRLLAAISQTLNMTVTQNVEKIIQKELQGSVLPSIQKLLATTEKNFAKNMQDELKKYVAQGIGSRLATLEGTLKEAISSQLATSINNNKGSGDVDVNALTAKLVEAVREPVQESFSGYFKEILVPSFEASCQKMFQQISHNFDNGLQHTFENVAQRSRELQQEASRGATSEVEAALLGQLGTAVHTLVEISANLNNNIIQTQTQLIQQLSQSAERREKEREKEPERVKDPRGEIEHLLSQERFEQAFVVALGERDLSLVTWLCSKLEPRGFFLLNRQALTQVTLLSLLQQLGFDLARDTILKLTWLTEIGTLLNPKDETIQPHAASILEALHSNLQALLSHPPSGGEGAQVASMCRVLTLILQSLLEPTARGGGGAPLSHSYSSLPTTPIQQQPPQQTGTPPPGFQYRY